MKTTVALLSALLAVAAADYSVSRFYTSPDCAEESFIRAFIGAEFLYGACDAASCAEAPSQPGVYVETTCAVVVPEPGPLSNLLIRRAAELAGNCEATSTVAQHFVLNQCISNGVGQWAFATCDDDVFLLSTQCNDGCSICLASEGGDVGKDHCDGNVYFQCTATNYEVTDYYSDFACSESARVRMRANKVPLVDCVANPTCTASSEISGLFEKVSCQTAMPDPPVGQWLTRVTTHESGCSGGIATVTHTLTNACFPDGSFAFMTVSCDDAEYTIKQFCDIGCSSGCSTAGGSIGLASCSDTTYDLCTTTSGGSDDQVIEIQSVYGDSACTPGNFLSAFAMPVAAGSCTPSACSALIDRPLYYGIVTCEDDYPTEFPVRVVAQVVTADGCVGEPEFMGYSASGRCVEDSGGNYGWFTCDATSFEGAFGCNADCTSCSSPISGGLGPENCIGDGYLECLEAAAMAVEVKAEYTDPACVGASFVYATVEPKPATDCTPSPCEELLEKPGSYRMVTCEDDIPAGFAVPTVKQVVTPNLDCTGEPLHVLFAKQGACYSVDGAPYYAHITCDETSFEGFFSCNADCTSCSSPFSGGLGPENCVLSAYFGCVAATSSDCSTTVYTEPLVYIWQTNGDELDATEISVHKDCLATADGVVLGGWTVTKSGEQVRMRCMYGDSQNESHPTLFL